MGRGEILERSNLHYPLHFFLTTICIFTHYSPHFLMVLQLSAHLTTHCTSVHSNHRIIIKTHCPPHHTFYTIHHHTQSTTTHASSLPKTFTLARTRREESMYMQIILEHKCIKLNSQNRNISNSLSLKYTDSVTRASSTYLHPPSSVP